MWIRPLEIHRTHAFCSRPFIGTGSYTERQLWHLYNEFGASPKDLATYASDPTAYESLVQQKLWTMNPDHLLRIFRGPRSGDVSHHVVIIQPSPTTRGFFETKIASRRVFELIWEIHLQHRISDMEYLYSFFQNSQTMAPAAGWIFELRMHQLLRRQQTIRLFPIRGRPGTTRFLYDGYTASKENPTDLQLAESDEYPLVEGDRLRMNRYYRLDSIDFPATDSVLLIHPPGEPSPILLMFQMTRNKREHNVDEEGLGKIDDLRLPRHTRRYYVVVTPEGIQPQIKVPPACFEGRGRRGISPDELFPVFHCPVRRNALFAR
jgi:hypothetical protein